MNDDRNYASNLPPVVLIISGHDPSGGAGVCADIQSVSALGCHPAPVITSLTVQDTRNAYEVLPIDADFVSRQVDAIVADMPIAAVKIGLLPDVAIAQAVSGSLEKLGGVPVVLDPVLVAAGGASLAESEVIGELTGQLLRLATLITPNAAELEALSGSADPDVGAKVLLDAGARHVLVKGADLDTEEVSNRLYDAGGLLAKLDWPRLPHRYHGSGCTLASALSALLARGESMRRSNEVAQSLVWEWLAAGFRPGQGQHVPWRKQPDAGL